MDWINMSNNSVKDYIGDANFDVASKYDTDFLEVSETISELSYLTHDYFRYYGKFPSKVANYIISTLVNQQKIDSKQDFVFDNYNGSGTSLVEAKMVGFYSGGVDVNPFGVLASNVKTFNYDVNKLRELFALLLEKIQSSSKETENDQLNMFVESNNTHSLELDKALRQAYLDFPDIDKWFDIDTVEQLSRIKYFILQMPQDRYREFFALGFFAIIRRVSRAHDAEVRPHVNPKKKKRDAVSAFEKKITEMISTMGAWNQVTSEAIESETVLCNNAHYEDMTRIIGNLSKRYSKDLGLVISHPPYLNCFDYIPVYKLKFLWAFGFSEIYGEHDYRQIKNEEIRSYPATNETIVNGYFKHNMDAYKVIFDNLRSGGYCCVVVGDCTIYNELVSVHKIFIHGMEKIGFEVEKVTYRSTAYGLGRYAYRHRADYNEKDGGKKDAIIFFRKP